MKNIQILKAWGFTPFINQGRTIYRKGEFAVCILCGKLLPCKILRGQPLSTGLYVDSVQELAKLYYESTGKQITEI